MDDIKRWYQGNRDKLSEHAKIEDLMYNWVTSWVLLISLLTYLDVIYQIV